MCHRRGSALAAVCAAFITWSTASAAAAADRLCDPAHEDCRAILIDLIRNEQVAIDVAFWFMEDSRYSSELINRWKAGVPVRVLVDTRANTSTPLNAERLKELQDAGIPMRERYKSGILHWKMMLFVGQNTVQFSGANYSGDAWVPLGEPYANYIDEAIFFTDRPSIIGSFKTKYDDLWIDTQLFRDYANITAPPARAYGIFTKDPELNFVPAESYANRAVGRYNNETTKIDVIMYRITDQRHTNAIIEARNRGIPVRLITEPQQYRDPVRMWHSWNIDRLYMAGVQVKNRAHEGLNHQKSVLLYGLGTTIFGSSNWTSPSSNSQEEHNLFTTDGAVFQWFTDQFERKWNNTTGVIETSDFTPLPPDKPAAPAPSDFATGVSTTVTLKWYGGHWAHVYDLYFGTTPDPPLYASDLPLGPSTTPTTFQSYAVPTTLASGTTYYWRVVAKTMANMTASSPVWAFTTGGTATGSGTAGPGDIVLYAAKAPVRTGAWDVVSDSSAAGGARIANADAAAPKVSSPLASPPSYFEMTFEAKSGTAYRLWLRGTAASNHWANDSVFVQFSGSVTADGVPQWRIDTTSGTSVNLEDCSGCGLSGWGWQDNGYGAGALGALVYFESAGTQTIRVQVREDGFSIDQILLSPELYLTTPPGALKNDTTVLPETDGAGGAPPADPEIVLYTADATAMAGAWTVEADATAAAGTRIRHPNANAAKVTSAAASPAHYFELTFTAEAGKAYRLWIRGKADADYWPNDSVFVQFSSSVDESGAATWRIGTTSATEVNVEECSGCGLAGWGWQDNGWGLNTLGPVVYFAATGIQTLRVQTREDGLSIDQIVLSPERYLTTAPGPAKNDTTILPKP